MELRQIRYFLEICEQGSFSRAADRGGVTQPALTMAMKALEGELGGAVFHREGRRLVLSGLGQMVCPHLRRLAGEQDNALIVAQNYKLLKQAPLRVGILPTIGPARIGRFLGVFRDQHPGVELAVSEGSVATLAKRLASADLDGEDYVDRLACEMREMVMKVVGERKVQLYAKFRSEREDWVQTMVLSGLGFAFMPEHSVTVGGLLSRALIEPAVARDVQAFEVRGRERTPAAALFLKGLAAFGWPG